MKSLKDDWRNCTNMKFLRKGWPYLEKYWDRSVSFVPLSPKMKDATTKSVWFETKDDWKNCNNAHRCIRKKLGWILQVKKVFADREKREWLLNVRNRMVGEVSDEEQKSGDSTTVKIYPEVDRSSNLLGYTSLCKKTWPTTLISCILSKFLERRHLWRNYD